MARRIKFIEEGFTIFISEALIRGRFLEEKDKIDNFLLRYPYSSYLDYVEPNGRSESIIIEKIAFPDYFENSKDLRDFMGDWLAYKNL